MPSSAANGQVDMKSPLPVIMDKVHATPDNSNSRDQALKSAEDSMQTMTGPKSGGENTSTILPDRPSLQAPSRRMSLVKHQNLEIHIERKTRPQLENYIKTLQNKS